MSGALQAVFQNQRSFGAPPGQQAFTTVGTFSWVAPSGVTSVSVVAVGGGGAGTGLGSYPCCYAVISGGGGGLGYKNNYSVNSGCSYTVVVGKGGLKQVPCSMGDNSYFVSTAVVAGKGGWRCRTSVYGCFVGDGGGVGGCGQNSSAGQNTGGGGAGGYSGKGGNGGTPNSNGSTGVGGGAGGGYGGLGGTGGGVGILGSGCSGAGGTSGSAGGKGGSGGSNGTLGTSGIYGGGGNANIIACANSTTGAKGAVRIIWPGNTRSFPSTCTGDL